VAPALISFFGAILVFFDLSKFYIAKRILSGETASFLTENTSTVISAIAVIFVFLTNSSAAFARIPNISEDDVKDFRDAAYGFMLCTILIFLSIGAYILFSLVGKSISVKLASNLISLILSLISITLGSLGYSLFKIAGVYLGKLIPYLEDRKMKQESFKIMFGTDSASLIICVIYWSTIWLWLYAYIKGIIQTALNLSLVGVLIHLGFILIIVNRQFVLDQDDERARLFSALTLLFLFILIYA
jgi:hypothetical protein